MLFFPQTALAWVRSGGVCRSVLTSLFWSLTLTSSPSSSGMVMCPPLTVLVRLFLAWCSLQSLFSSLTPFFSHLKDAVNFGSPGLACTLISFLMQDLAGTIYRCISRSLVISSPAFCLLCRNVVFFRRIRKWLWAIEFRGYQVWGHVQADVILNYEATSRYLERFSLQMQMPLATQRKHSQVPPSLLFPVCFLSIFLISFP